MIESLIQFKVLVPWLLGMVFGVFVGATPGLTATMAVALIVPLSFHMEPTAGLAMIIGVSFTAIFAGDIPATYLRIPGTPASAAATLDGHELAKKGRGHFALMLDLFCSCIGGLVGVGLLILIAPLLAKFALNFTHFEYFWLGVLGLSISAVVCGGDTFKALMSAALGLLIATAGRDIIANVPRYTFGSIHAEAGLSFIPAMIGLFGVSEVLRNVLRKESLSAPTANETERTTPFDTLIEIWKHKWTVLKSSIVGTTIGALPGAGADIAAWGAYGLAKKTSRNTNEFGSGETEGVIAPTSANNAAVAGAWIPALVFGVPGDAVTAIVLGAFVMYNIKPGPQLFQSSGDQVNQIFAIALITQFLLLACGFLGIKTFGWILKLPRSVVMVAVLVFSVVGAYALNNSFFDVYVMIAFGVVGFFMESQRVPLAPMILGMILGPMVEEKLRTGLIATSGDITPFFTRPISAVLVGLLVIAFVLPAIVKVKRLLTPSASGRGSG